MKYLLFSGSLREGSFNKKLVHVVNKKLIELNKITDVIDLKSLNIPVYDGDVEAQSGIPVGVQKLAHVLEQCQALVISSPEYNGAMPGVIKNTLDWLSRLKVNPLEGKTLLLLGASPGALGAIRMLTDSKIQYENLGIIMYPRTFGLAKAHEAFKPDESMTSVETQNKLFDLVDKYIVFAEKIHNV